MKKPPKYRFDTLAQHAGYNPEEHRGHLSEPIYEGVAVKQQDCKTAARRFSGEEDGLTYGRAGNDTALIFEKRLAALEGGESALSFASGIAAIRCLVLKLVGPGDNLVSSRRLYGGTGHFFENEISDLGRKVIFVKDAQNAYSWSGAINKRTRALYLEMPANPTVDLYPLIGIAGVAQKNCLPLIVDSTFATPALFRPLEYGTSFVIHSGTKYLSAGCVGLAGAIVGSRDFLKDMRLNEYLSYGAPLSALHAKFCLLGLSTLNLRMRWHSESAKLIVGWLSRNYDQEIEKIFYPRCDLLSVDFAQRYMPDGCGGVFSLEFRWPLGKCEKFVDSLELFSNAVNLGDPKSLVVHPTSTTHSKMGKEARKKAGISDSLVRFSVGLEDPSDLIDDISRALKKVGVRI